MPGKRLPLPRRFNVGLTDKAYEALRSLNSRYGFGNNYLLTVLLENLDDIVVPSELERVFADFKREYGAPAPGAMRKRK